MSEQLRTSPLDAAHRALGARMVPFGGWDMPIQYAGVIEEHRACREAAVVFDVSHLGSVRVEGSGAFDALQWAFTNDLDRIEPGRAQYTHLLDETDAHVVDDIIVWWLAADEFIVMPNASNTAPLIRALEEAAARVGDGACRIEDITDEPETLRTMEAKLLGRCLAEDVKLADGTVLPRNTEIREDEVRVIVADPANERVRVRSVLTCDSLSGVCVACQRLGALAELARAEMSEIVANAYGVPGGGFGREYLIPKGKHVSVQEGDFVRRGDPLVDGPRVPHDILKVLGVPALSDYLVNEIQEVYRLQGVRINDKHIEVIVRQMLRRIVIVDSGDTGFLDGDLVDRFEFTAKNREAIQSGAIVQLRARAADVWVVADHAVSAASVTAIGTAYAAATALRSARMLMSGAR